MLHHHESRLDMYQPPPGWDCRLAIVFRDFQVLVAGINHNVREHSVQGAECFQSVLSSLQSRLMHLEHALYEPTEQLVRLSLLAFLATTFKIPGRRIPYSWLAQRIEAMYAEAYGDQAAINPILRQWIVVVAAISISKPDDEWMQGARHDCTFETDWQALKCELKSVMWIECIHDEPGERLYRQLSKHQVREVILTGTDVNVESV